MAKIEVNQIQNYVDTLQDWVSLNESPAKECLLIKFKQNDKNIVIDEDFVNKTLYLQSGNGNVVISFDSTGQVSSIEIV